VLLELAAIPAPPPPPPDCIQAIFSKRSRVPLSQSDAENSDQEPAPKRTKSGRKPKPKAKDFEPDVEDVLIAVCNRYEARIIGKNPFPDAATRRSWAKHGFKLACQAEGVSETKLTTEMCRVVCPLLHPGPVLLLTCT
jgi:hypothetical protein